MVTRQSRRERHAARGVNTPALPPLTPSLYDIQIVRFDAAQQKYINELLEKRNKKFVERGIDNKILRLYKRLLALTELELMLTKRMLTLVS